MLGRCQELTLYYVQACVMENSFGLNSATVYLRKLTEVGLESWERSVFIYGTISNTWIFGQHLYSMYFCWEKFLNTEINCWTCIVKYKLQKCYFCCLKSHVIGISRVICVALDIQKICNMAQSYMCFGMQGINGT